jgi:hypothetical protein
LEKVAQIGKSEKKDIWAKKKDIWSRKWAEKKSKKKTRFGFQVGRVIPA